MRGVELAQHLAEHLLEVIVVVDVWQELLVGLAIAFPIHAMKLWIVELVLYLSPDMVEEVLALCRRLVVEVCLEVHCLGAIVGEVYLLDAVAVAEEEVLDVLVCLETTIAYIFENKLGRAILQVSAPEVVATLKGCLIVNLITIFGEDGIAHVG